MPAIDFTQPDEFTKIITWQVVAPYDELAKELNLNQERTNKYNQLSKKRQGEYLGLIACMRYLNLYEVTVLYDDLGKPFINKNHHLSITHSHGLVSVALSDFKIGVDIELRRTKKIQNIKSKFIREDENPWLPNNQTQSDFLHIIWGIKEGLYKLNGGNLWNFLHHYRVEPFDLVEQKPIVCWISNAVFSRKYYAFYKTIGNHFLIWVLDYD